VIPRNISPAAQMTIRSLNVSRCHMEGLPGCGGMSSVGVANIARRMMMEIPRPRRGTGVIRTDLDEEVDNSNLLSRHDVGKSYVLVLRIFRICRGRLGRRRACNCRTSTLPPHSKINDKVRSAKLSTVTHLPPDLHAAKNTTHPIASPDDRLRSPCLRCQYRPTHRELATVYRPLLLAATK